MRIDSLGAGIGTSSPESNAQATIYEDSGNTPLYLKANNANSYLYFEDSGTSSFKVAVGSSSNKSPNLLLTAPERTRIDSSGLADITTGIIGKNPTDNFTSNGKTQPSSMVLI